MKSHSKSSTIVAVLAVTLGASCPFFAACTRAEGAPGERGKDPLVRVATAEVIEVSAPILLRLTGSLRGMKEADLAANAAGRVVRTFVERGDEIKQGAIVAQLDTSSAALSLEQARVDVDSQKTQHDINQSECARYEQLKAKGAVSPLEYDQAVAKCKTAPLNLLASQARQNIAEKSVGDGTIRAPFAGVVSERYVEVGEYVQPSSKVVALAVSSDLRLEFVIPEANIAGIAAGADVSFFVAAYPNKVFYGKVRHVSGAVRATTRDLVAEAIVGNGDKLLRPGMFADVSLVTGFRPLPSVPAAAVFERQEKKRVYVVTGGKLEERVLQDGPLVDGRVSVESGVKNGEKVAIGNLANLLNGQSVE
jgi:RND family efflux transporter MFP subunit